MTNVDAETLPDVPMLANNNGNIQNGNVNRCSNNDICISFSAERLSPV
jgi:hypothetical protein